MKKLNVKTVVLLVLAMILCVTSCVPAFASTGDRVLFRTKTSEDGSFESGPRGAWNTKDGLCLLLRGADTKILRYKDIHGEPETFELETRYFSVFDSDGNETAEGMEGLEGIEGLAGAEGTEAPEQAEPSVSPVQESTETGDGDEEDEDDEEDSFLFNKSAPAKAPEKAEEEEEDNDFYDLTNCFSWNGELYAMTASGTTTEENGDFKYTIDKIAVKHVKLEDGKIILEKSDVPGLDPQYLVQDYDGYENLVWINRPITAGKYLAGFVWADSPKIVIYDLTDGSGKEVSASYDTNIAPGGDGFILITHTTWAGDSVNAKICKLNLEDQSEEELVEIKGLSDSQLSFYYEQEKNTLYYLASGQLWIMPELDPEKAEAVNDCAENSADMELLPGGYMLIWSTNTAMVKNTDPSQRGNGTTLNVYYATYDTQAANDAIFEMSNARNDISVVLQQDWYSNVDLLQTMINRDGHTDIFVMRYDENAFKAVRDRGYLPDLSDNAQLSGYIDRMYPYLQDAAKKDGKLIAIPVSVNAGGIKLNMAAWKKLGGTEAELPKTWDEFLDWIMTLPKRLEGTEYKLVNPYTDFSQLRSLIGDALMTSYQLVMDRKGEDYSFNTPLLKNLLQRIADIDYEALGIPRELKQEDYNDIDGYSTGEILLESSSYGMGIDSYDPMVPLALSFSKDEDPVVPVTVYAGFVNPYSEHPEEAKELLALILKNLNLQMQYVLFTDKTEPIEYSYAADSRKWHEQYMTELQESLEKAEDGNKALIEEQIRQEEKDWEQQEHWLWLVSQEMMDAYLKCQEKFAIEDYSIFSNLWQAGDKEYARIVKAMFGYEMVDQKTDDISMEEALALIDQKVQMKRREGN